MPENLETEVTVIGGGFVGLSTAYYVAKQGIDVVLVERGELASGASGANNGQIELWPESRGQKEVEELALKGKKMYRTLSKKLGYNIDYHERIRSLTVFTDEEVERMKKLKIGGNIISQMVKRDSLKISEPSISENFAWGVEGYLAKVNPFKLCYGFALAAKRFGAKILTHTEVKNIKVSNRKVCAVVTDGGEIKTNFVVNAAGVWSPLIGEMVCINIPIVPQRGVLMVTEPTPPLFNHEIIRAGSLFKQLYPEKKEDPRIRLSIGSTIDRQQMEGNYLLGRETNSKCGYDIHEYNETIKYMAEYCTQAYPPLEGLNIIRTFAGLRPICYVDEKPIFGKVKDVDGFLIATGTGAYGIVLATIGGKLIAELVGEDATSFPIDEVSYARFNAD